MENPKQHFNNLLAVPEGQHEEDESFLQDQAVLFPYCQSLKFALARHSSVFRLKDSEERTSTAAIYAPDRIVLFNLLAMPFKVREDRELLPDQEQLIAVVPAAAEFTLPEVEIAGVLHAGVPETEHQPPAISAVSPVPSFQYTSKVQARAQERAYQEDVLVRKTFLYWLKKTQRGYFLNSDNSGSSSFGSEDTSYTSIDPKVDPLEKNYQAAIFRLEESEQIISQPEVVEVKDVHLSPETSVPGVEFLPAQSTSELGMVTETLAAIYYQQKLYTKALQAYDDLTLKFPNKSAYFAALQEKIRKERNK